MDSALVLIEWPERLGDLAPANMLTLRLSIAEDDSRTLRLEWSDTKWNSVVNDLEQALAGND